VLNTLGAKREPIPTGFLLPEILNVLSKQCPLVETTSEVDAMDAGTKPSTLPRTLRTASRYTTTTLAIGSIALYCTVQASRDAFRYAITALIPKSSVPTRFLSPKVLNVLSKQCPLLETTCEVDTMDASTKPLTVPHALHIASQYAITALVIGSIVFYCIMVG
jgi:hypothetical protein